MKIVPYDLFVKYLITKGSDTLTKLNEELKKFRLSPVSEPIFNRHYTSLRTNLPTPIWNQIVTQKVHGPAFLRWMDGLSLKSIWENHKAYSTDETKKFWSLTFDILEDPTVRMSTNAMIMKGVGFDDLAQMLNAKFSCMLKAPHIEAYKKYFWNPAYMTRRDWRDYMAQSDIGNAEKDILFSALTEIADVVRTKLGLPAGIITSDVLQFMATEAMLKAKHYLRVNDQTGNTEARAWMTQTERLLTLREKYKAADLRDFSKELQMQFEYVDTEFDSPDAQALKEVREKDVSSKEERAASEAMEGEEDEQGDLGV